MAPSPTLPSRLKIQLKLSISRLRTLQQRDENASKASRRAMALLLSESKINSARIRVENIIRTDILIELHEILELYCELLLARIGMMEARDIDPGLEEAVKSIIYAAPKTECKELQAVRALLGEKYGKEFLAAAGENRDGKVGEKVVRKLRVEAPSEALVQGYLEEIAATYGVDWPKRASEAQVPTFVDEAEEGKSVDDGEGEGGGDTKEDVEAVELAQATPPRNVGVRSPLRVNPPKSTTENPHPKVKAVGTLDLKPSARMVDAGKKVEAKTPKSDLEELAARFAALKR